MYIIYIHQLHRFPIFQIPLMGFATLFFLYKNKVTNCRRTYCVATNCRRTYCVLMIQITPSAEAWMYLQRMSFSISAIFFTQAVNAPPSSTARVRNTWRFLTSNGVATDLTNAS